MLASKHTCILGVYLLHLAMESVREKKTIAPNIQGP